ncbi:MAG: hypothetical protein ABI769_06300 [Pseudomonadota bacterium]
MHNAAAMNVAGAFFCSRNPPMARRLDHIAEMFRLEGDEIMGDLRPRSESRLAVLPDTTHLTLMQKGAVIIPMINDFLDAKPTDARKKL